MSTDDETISINEGSSCLELIDKSNDTPVNPFSISATALSTDQAMTLAKAELFQEGLPDNLSIQHYGHSLLIEYAGDITTRIAFSTDKAVVTQYTVSENPAILLTDVSSEVLSLYLDSLRDKSEFIRESLRILQVPQLDPEIRSRTLIQIAEYKKLQSDLGSINPEVTGVCSEIESKEVDPHQIINVGVQGYSFGRADDPNSRYLHTVGLGPCICLIAYDRFKREGVMFHISKPGECSDAVNILQERYSDSNLEVILYGGNGDVGDDSRYSGSSSALTLLNLSKSFGDNMKIIGTDILGHKEREIAIDLQTGSLFIPIHTRYGQNPKYSALEESQRKMGREDLELICDGIGLMSITDYV